MRIISFNTCKQCCYCMEDNDGFGTCCKDNIYKHVSINQHACRFFCQDGENFSSYDDTDIDDFLHE